MTIITSPHDKLFKTTMSDVRVAREFVETVKEGLLAPTGEKIMTLAEQLIERGTQNGFRLGKQAGLQEGVQVGFLQCGHEMLMRQLKRKFVVLPPHYQKLVEQADKNQMDEWSVNLLDAKTLDEVFED